MSKDELQREFLKVLSSGQIHPTTIIMGDNVQNKIEKVESGGVVNIVDSAKTHLPIPKESDYNAVREYIEKRKEQDEVFKTYCLSHTRKEVCEFLSIEFGWVVDSHHLGVNIGRN